MASNDSDEQGTLIVAAYLLLALAFAVCWILYYASTGQAPWQLMPWFGGAAAGISVLALALAIRRLRR